MLSHITSKKPDGSTKNVLLRFFSFFSPQKSQVVPVDTSTLEHDCDNSSRSSSSQTLFPDDNSETPTDVNTLGLQNDGADDLLAGIEISVYEGEISQLPRLDLSNYKLETLTPVLTGNSEQSFERIKKLHLDISLLKPEKVSELKTKIEILYLSANATSENASDVVIAFFNTGKCGAVQVEPGVLKDETVKQWVEDTNRNSKDYFYTYRVSESGHIRIKRDPTLETLNDPNKQILALKATQQGDVLTLVQKLNERGVTFSIGFKARAMVKTNNKKEIQTIFQKQKDGNKHLNAKLAPTTRRSNRTGGFQTGKVGKPLTKPSPLTKGLPSTMLTNENQPPAPPNQQNVTGKPPLPPRRE